MRNLFLILCFTVGMATSLAAEILSFTISYDDVEVNGYYTPPSTSSDPIVFAISGSSTESVYEWHTTLADLLSPIGLGLIILEKPGVNADGVDWETFDHYNCLDMRIENYQKCLENVDQLAANWDGKAIFWGESEGGLIASHLANEYKEDTLAVLLFAPSGGVHPTEEIKWTLEKHLTSQGVLSDDIQNYLGALDVQFDAMQEAPLTSKRFLGNTYKWWNSFLKMKKGLSVLNDASLPIYLVHGDDDQIISVQGSDVAASTLNTHNQLTYLRLKNYGHNLRDSANLISARDWLRAIMFNHEYIPLAASGDLVAHAPIVNANWESDLADYWFVRDVQVSATATIRKDNEGKTTTSAGVSASKSFGNHVNIEAKSSASQTRDRDGHTTKEASTTVSVNLTG